MRGQSSVREVDLATGAVVRLKKLPFADFGEGLASFDDRYYHFSLLLLMEEDKAS